HIAFDGWSLGIFIDKLKSLSNARIRGTHHPLDLPNPLVLPNLFVPLAIIYRDFSRWQKGWLQSDPVDKEKSYWCMQLNGMPEVHSLRLDFPRPAVLGNSGSNYRVRVPASLAHKVSRFAQANNTSVFVAWYTLFSLFIARLGNSKDVVIGTAVANREVQHTKEIIGLFINTVMLRMKPDDSANLIESLTCAREIVNQGYAHQSLPLRLMIELSKVPPSLSYSPLCQINFS